MATGTKLELADFHRFVDEQLQRGETQMAPEAAFRSRQLELDRLEAVRVGLEQADRGEARPLDVAALKQRVRNELARRGSSHDGYRLLHVMGLE